MKPGLQIRTEFPIFEHAKQAGLEPAFLDSAASSQKPSHVINSLKDFLESKYANIHRGAYSLSIGATLEYEKAREKVARFIGASQAEELIFVRGTTEGINLIAHALNHKFSSGDVILLTELEHHSNIVPWQMLAARSNLKIEFAKINRDASLDLEDFKNKLEKFKPKLVSTSYISNAFGTVLPVKQIIEESKNSGALVLIDGAQAVPHKKVEVSSLGADFFVFSGHKMYGPTGIGGLWVNPKIIQTLEAFHGGGDMIETVTTDGYTLAEPPQRFEAGTPAIAEAVALGAAVDFLNQVGINNIAEHEEELFQYAFDQLSAKKGVIIYGPRTTNNEQASIISFNLEGQHAHDIASFADQKNIQIRTGHHCAMPALKSLGLSATARMSLGMYNTKEDIDRLIEVIEFTKKILS